MSWVQIKKIVILKCCLLLFYATAMNHFLIRLWCVMKNGFYVTVSNNQLSGWTEKLQSTSQSQTCTRKNLVVTVWWSAAHLIHDSFLNPIETITSEKYGQQIDEMHWKLQRLQLVLVNRRSQMLHHDNTWPYVTQPVIQKLNKLSYQVLPHPPYPFFKHVNDFLQGKHFDNQWEAENALQEFVGPQSMDFYATGINQLLIGKNVLVVMVLILMNKDVSELS